MQTYTMFHLPPSSSSIISIIMRFCYILALTNIIHMCIYVYVREMGPFIDSICNAWPQSGVEGGWMDQSSSGVKHQSYLNLYYGSGEGTCVLARSRPKNFISFLFTSDKNLLTFVIGSSGITV